jgi:hypothetical protein
MAIIDCYQTNTSSSVYLAYSTFHIDNWGTHPLGVIAKLTNEVYYPVGNKYTAPSVYPDIGPGEYWYGNLSLGYTTYFKDQLGDDDYVMTEHWASDNGLLAYAGHWEVIWWDDLTMETIAYP